jgi:carbohydrate diacid regulator
MSLGVSRLVTSVPIEKCKAFLNEVLKEDVLREIDNETMNTVQRFLDCDLNISLAARELYIHRNTLVFRLDKLKSLTGLDVRKFEDAMLLKMAMLIHRYLRTSRGGNSL